MMWCVPTWLRCERTEKRCERDNRKVNRLARGNASHDVSWLQIPAHTPLRCALSSASAICLPYFSTCLSGSGPCLIPLKSSLGFAAIIGSLQFGATNPQCKVTCIAQQSYVSTKIVFFLVAKLRWH